MALFTSSPTESPFAPPNVLFDVASGQALQRGKMNDLLLLKQQQEIDDAAAARKGVDAYVEQLNSSLAPAKTATPVAGSLEQQLGASEGGTNPAAVNKGGYSGQFQFGAARLADLGIYKPAEGEDLSKNEWKGTFNLPPYNVTTHDQFLQSPAAQHAAFQQHVANIDQAIAATPGADKLDPNGLRAVAHLGGVGGMRRFIQTGGAYNPGDANGTHLSDYYAKFAAGGVPALQQAFGDPQGRGVAARTGGVDVAGPGAPAPAQAAPQAPAVGGLLPNGLTAEQTRDLTLRARMAAGRPDALAGVMSEADRLRAANQAQLHQAQQDQRQAANDAYQRQQNADAAARAKEQLDLSKSADARAAATAAMQPDQILAKYRTAMINGTATDEERALYAIGAQHYMKPVPTWVDSVTEPGKKELVNVPGNLPEGYPPPNYRPTPQAQPQAAPATSPTVPQPPEATHPPGVPAVPAAPIAPSTAVVPAPPAAPVGPYPWSTPQAPLIKTDQRVSKPLPEADRKLLLGDALKLDQVGDAKNTFKDNFAGYGSKLVGDAANTIAANTPGESPRADWWRNYQIVKLAARQSISGQSLTESEKDEFEKANINLGMSPETIRTNLKRQNDLLRIGQARHARSLLADGFGKSAIEEAGGIKLDETTALPAGTGLSGGQSSGSIPPPPPGFKVIQ